MSSSRRPWFPWYPKEFISDEKVKGLSDDAELIYRRTLDVMWQANALQLPSNCQVLLNQIARGWQLERFKKAWAEIQRPGFEILKTTDDGEYVYSERLRREAQHIETINKKRRESGKKGGLAKAKQTPSKRLAKPKQTLSNPHPHPYIKEKDTKVSKKKKFKPPNIDEVKAYFNEKGYLESVAEKAFEYYQEANWHDSTGKKIKNWKQKMIAVWFREENKDAMADLRKKYG